MIRVLALGLLLGLGGCLSSVPPPIIVTKNVQVRVPLDLMKCPGVKLPDPTTLTDKQVAKLLIALSGANSTCRASMDAIKKFQDDVDKELAGSVPPAPKRK